MFRGKFLAALKTMDLDFCGSAKQYEDPSNLQQVSYLLLFCRWTVFNSQHIFTSQAMIDRGAVFG